MKCAREVGEFVVIEPNEDYITSWGIFRKDDVIAISKSRTVGNASVLLNNGSWVSIGMTFPDAAKLFFDITVPATNC